MNTVSQDGPAAKLGALYREVELRELFEDSKTFADAEPLRPLVTILREFQGRTEWTDEALRNWINERFHMPESPPQSTAAIDATLAVYIRSLWPALMREAVNVVADASLISLPRPYIAPGGRFRELYYWDTYFTMLGLKADGREELIEGMIDNFVSLIHRFGHIPNGTRTYYLGRSQPPVFHLMLELSECRELNRKTERLEALRAEHAFWMRGAANLAAGTACERVVALPDGGILNRYFDAKDTPRDEAFRADIVTADTSSRAVAAVFRDLRAGAESGWDFSSRWLAEPSDFSSIRTTAIAPIDLNCLMWSLERTLARLHAEEGSSEDARRFSNAAVERLACMRRWCLDGATGLFGDVLWADGAPTDRLTAAAVFPAFVGACTDAEAEALARVVRTQLLAPGGLRTTLVKSGQQWDKPNGWAPLQWAAAEGLRRYAHGGLADEIARRWLDTVGRVYASKGRLLEKYDVEVAEAGCGGEYPLQEGFGWTNGVTQAFLAQATERS